MPLRDSAILQVPTVVTTTNPSESGRFLFNHATMRLPTSSGLWKSSSLEKWREATARLLSLCRCFGQNFLRGWKPLELIFDRKHATQSEACVDDLDTLEALQAAINAAFGTQSVLVHDREKVQVGSGRNLRPTERTTHIPMVVHRRPSFVAVAIFDLDGNARQVGQQIALATHL
ncbi:hypothetical protein ACFHWW_33380 [Ensifer sp. P24N7]|uniref:hypothetical protein n=1 Tax=Sinorhizobium sp. P24N7 TaxID=3348358 RepID=UPI0035F3B8C1